MSTKKSYLSTDDLSKTLELPVDGQLFINILKRIRQISKQIFNPHESYDNQENEKIAEFSAKMSQEFADVLQGPTLSAKVQRARTKAVLLYCSQCFNSYRNHLRKKERALTPGLSTPPSTRGIKKKSKKTLSHQVATPSPTVRSTSLRPRRKRKTPRTPSPSESRYTTKASRGGSVVSETPPPRTPSAPPTLPSTPSSTTFTENPYSALIARHQVRKPEANVSAIAEFLGTCEPDMRYLLPSFMAFGCRNVEFLVNISCQKEEDIESILKKIMQHDPPLEGVEQMDLLVVTKHFKEYFFGQSKMSVEP